MAHDQQQLNELLEKMQRLQDKQKVFSEEIDELKGQINRLMVGQFDQVEEPKKGPTPPPAPEPVARVSLAPKKPSKTRSELEKFVGENLINKIGIAVTILGVSIGAKYAIDNELISPLMRILLGGMVGVVLIALGYRLKKNFEAFSAVLLSGGIAILYFMTFLGYDLYALMPMEVAFGIMVLLTAYAVQTATWYNQQVIALIGQVGAYAIPFLLSDGTGNMMILFTYILIINTGLLVLAHVRQWRLVYYSAFGLTWLIFFSWIVTSYDKEKPLIMALTFASLYFLLFYSTFLAFKIRHARQFQTSDVLVVLINTFIFYSICYVLLDQHETANAYLGLFTLCVAVVHVVVALVLQYADAADKHFFFLVSGLALVFITMAVPVQFDGNWVTLLWAGQAALLFWIGRARGVAMYEKLAYPMIAVTAISLMHDWSVVRESFWKVDDLVIQPFQSITFFTALIVVGIFGFIYYFYQKSPAHALSELPNLSGFVQVALPVLLLISLYYTFYVEIDLYWHLRINVPTDVQSDAGADMNAASYHLKWFKIIWLNTYTLSFVTALLILNVLKTKSRAFGTSLFVLNVVVMVLFLIGGLYALSELREYYLQQVRDGQAVEAFSIGIRYLVLALVAVNLVFFYKMVYAHFMEGRDRRKTFDIFLFGTVVWILSSELIHWMSMAQSEQSYKLALSILWGVYSLAFVIIGIWKNKQHFRVVAIALFGVTLLKLFFYDISHLNTISKTIVFVSLGVLLLIISFLYNKYKHVIGEEKENDTSTK